jgi:hypothetical protein
LAPVINLTSVSVEPWAGAAAQGMRVCWDGGWPGPGDDCPAMPKRYGGRVRCIPDGKASHVDILTYLYFMTFNAMPIPVRYDIYSCLCPKHILLKMWMVQLKVIELNIFKAK